jgi:2-keto-4-pentenoate hydratase
MAPSIRTAQAASLLWRNWQAKTHLPGLPDELRPRDRAEAYDVGEAVVELSGDEVIGWKIAATSKTGQEHINVDGPLGGRLLKSRLIGPGGRVVLGNNVMRVAEAEFAFGFDQPLSFCGRPYEQAEVMAAVSTLHLSIEIPDSRFSNFTSVGALQLIADMACASWLMLGPAVEVSWRSIDLVEHQVTAYLHGHQVASGSGKAVLGDPRAALTWLVNEVVQFGGGIKVGDSVTTGTCLTPVPIRQGDVVTMDYGALGSMSVIID